LASRKEQREQARKEREEREAAERAKAQRKRRLLMLGGVLAAAAVVVVVAIVISSGSSSKKTNATGGVEGAQQSAQLLKGIPQKGIVLGKPDAPVTLTEFADLQCPFCRDYTLKTFPTIVAKYVRSGKVKMVFRNYAFISEDSLTAARAAESSGLQNKLWNFIDVFYNNQGEEKSGYVTDEFVTKIGNAAGVDTDKMLKDRSDPRVDQAIAEAQQEATKAGVNSTPTFLIQSGNSAPKKVQQSAFDPNEFSKAIDEALANSGT
jgi:protein-disulfide isomerase